MANMNLDVPSTRDDKGPYATIHVSIDEIESITGHNGQLENVTAKHVMDILGRRSDFTFGHQGVIIQAFHKATIAAAKNVPEALKEICKKYFGGNPEGFVPIYETNDSDGPIMGRSRTKNLQFYLLKPDGFEEFDGVFEPGESRRFMAFHKITMDWVGADSIDEMSRGLSIQKTDGFGVEKAIKDLLAFKEREREMGIAAQVKKGEEK
jgi:hypothetical protein